MPAGTIHLCMHACCVHAAAASLASPRLASACGALERRVNPAAASLAPTAELTDEEATCVVDRLEEANLE